MTVLDRLRLDGKVALITGGGSGLGQAMALAMADAGAEIAVSGRRIEPLQETQRLVQAKGRRCFVTQADVTDSAQVNRMIAEVIAHFGHLNVLVNNAGGGGAGRDKTLLEFTDEDWRQGIDANLSSTFYCCRAALPHFLERGSGRVINVSSGQAFRGQRHTFMYAAAKAGVVQFTRTLAITYARDGIRATCIAPGWFQHFQNPDEPSPRFALQAAGRAGTTYEIGPLAVFLASDASDYMSGQTVLLDGGAVAGGILPTSLAPTVEE
ncbi:MAG: SDR family oxidoreductase [Dehalococcoidia bacterium]|nr:SDR family oxidoreductase [Dehalococcoidia bacterium]